MNIVLRSISSHIWSRNLVVRYAHYLADANPIRQPKDVVSGILNNTVYHDSDVIVCNKPPGVMVLGKLKR